MFHVEHLSVVGQEDQAMGRIAEEELERLKQEVRLEHLAEARGVELQRHGEDLVGRCVFHEDREPSMVITPAKNLFHCFGCAAAGSPLDWVMKLEGVSFRQAVEMLRAGYPVAVAASERPVKHTTRRKLPPPIALDAEDYELLRQVVDYYHERLKQSPEALSYLEKRGLQSSEMIERFRLGYADRTLGMRLPMKNRKAGGEIRSRLQKLGILRESGHEHFNGSVVIPIFDEHGAVAGMYGRKIRSDLRPGTPLHLYLPGPHRGVWNLEALVASREIILCEALIDALTFWCAGYRNVTASYGVEGFTEEHLSALKRHKTERVLIAYDRDQAGERAAATLGARLKSQGIDWRRVEFPHGMDANQYALKVTPAHKSLGIVLRKALGLTGMPAPAAEEQPAAKAAKEEKVPEPTPSEPSRPEEQLSSLAAEAAAAELPGPPAVPAPPTDVPAEIAGDQVVLVFADRRYRVRGLEKNTSHNQLRVNVLVSRADGFYVDTLDLYLARQRSLFVKQAAAELGIQEEILYKDLGRVLFKLEELQDELVRKTLQPKSPGPVLSDSERDAAIELLRDPKLLERILLDLGRCGVIGEESNKLVGYLAAVSRKLDRPLGVVIQSSSAAGKSSLMDAILSFMPEEEQVKYSAMTGQSLFYMGAESLKHKILGIAEGEGAEKASYALKLLQSEGELSIASTGKDPNTGKLITHEYRVEGPVMLFSTTTAIEVDEELLNRCIVLAVNEGREQTRAIHRLQRHEQTLSGMLEVEERREIRKLHQNGQRLLRPLWVVNPYAPALTFLDDQTRTRRDHLKYLTLVRAIALLHQYQRPVKTAQHRGKTISFIEVEHSDIELANRLANEVLGRSLDHLPPQTRRLLLLIDSMAAEACSRLQVERSDYRFRCREVREHTGWGSTQLKVHLHRLVEMEYLLLHRATRGQSFVYELLYQGQGKDGEPFLIGLLDPKKLPPSPSADCNYDEKWSGSSGRWSGQNEGGSASGRVEIGPWPGAGRSSSGADDSGPEDPNLAPALVHAQRAPEKKSASYAQRGGRNGATRAAERL